MAALGQIDLHAALNRFGLEDFRKGQEEVISHIIAGHDCLCVMPTGGGKSLCYQLPSLVRPGLTIVVSPLIALMKDQVDALSNRGISATLINSTLTTAEQNQRLEHVAGGHYSMVYVAPERLRNSRFLDAIRTTPIQLLAVDEAHCISEWGHDFRPDYQRLGRFREALGGVQTVALTATATPKVRQDIVDSLKLRVAKHFITGFARDNLYLGSMLCMGDREKDKQLLDFIKDQVGAGIIYAATRKRCEALVDQIGKELKISVGAYHAGLLPEQRKLIQEQFMSGQLKVIIATNAFGMGIDKSDLRYVVHYNTPGTLEAYYQEAGRAGRDSLPSQCVLLYSPQDRYIQEFFIENANPPRELLESVYELLVKRPEDPIELTAEEIRELTNAPATTEAINSCLQILGRTSVMERLEMSGGLAMFRIDSKLPTLLDLLPKAANVQRTVLRAVEKAIGDRREEAVYIHPRWLMQQLQMDRDALNRTLRELCKLDSFEYVPPFRGRAIHFRRRDVPFSELKIDHETLAARKKADYEKLDRMVSYAQSRSCRQKTILEYFGDASASNCGICDRCQGKTGWPNMPKVTGLPEPKAKEKKSKTKSPKALPKDSLPIGNSAVGTVTLPDVALPPRVNPSVEPSASKSPQSVLPASTPVATTPVAKTSVAAKESKPTVKNPIDSEDDPLPTSLLPSETKPAYDLIVTILKAVEKTHGYLSKTLLTQHLSGVESKAVQGLRLQRLPEFGILKSWKKSHASGFLDQMLDVDLLCISELRVGKVTVSISDQGRGLVAGTIEMPSKIMLFVHHCILAAEKSNGIAITTPSKPQDWSDPIETAVTVKTGPKLERQQTHLISTIGKEYPPTASDDPVRPIAQLPRASVSDASAGRDVTAPMIEDWRWTVRLVEHGYRLGECALIRGKTPDSILEDLTKALQDGKRFTIEHLFDRRTQIAVKELREHGDPQAAPPSIFQSYPSLWRFIQRWLELC
jgi:RecQ family ATP-dependent DNA helicase